MTNPQNQDPNQPTPGGYRENQPTPGGYRENQPVSGGYRENQPVSGGYIDPMLADQSYGQDQHKQPGAGLVDPNHPYAADYVDPYQDENYDPEEWERMRPRLPFALRSILIILAVIATLAFAYARANTWLQTQIEPPGVAGESVVIEVPAGASDRDVMRILAEKGVITNSTVAQYWIRVNEVGDFQAGEYIFRANSSFVEATDVLRAGPLPPVFKRVTIPEGLWLGDMRNVLLDNLLELNPTELDTALNSGAIRSLFQPRDITTLEGLLFPATYQVGEDEAGNAPAIVQRLVNTMDQVIVELGVDDGLTLESGRVLSPYELVIVASMIEEEALLDDERAKMARVIYNRLDADWSLGIDATTIYGTHLKKCKNDPKCHNPSTSFDWFSTDIYQSELDDETDPYNTRLIKGLPPTPVSAPGRASLRAALNPEPGPWMYYVLVNKDGTHFFTDSAQEFEAAVAEAKANGVF